MLLAAEWVGSTAVQRVSTRADWKGARLVEATAGSLDCLKVAPLDAWKVYSKMVVRSAGHWDALTADCSECCWVVWRDAKKAG